MGPLGKVAAYRWLSAGDDGGAGGSPGLVVVLLVFVGIAAVLLAFDAAVTVVTSWIYGTLRPVMIRAPTASSLLGGVLLASLVLLIGPYPEDTARTLLTDRHPDSTVPATATDTRWFYVRNLAVIGFVAGYVALGVPVGEEVVALLEGVVSVPVALFPLVMLGSFVALVYTTVQIVRLPYRYRRLLGRAPRGGLASVAVILPVTATAIGEAFDLPFVGVENDAVGVAFVLVPYLGGLVLVKVLAEPHVVRAAPATAGRAGDSPPDPEGGGASERSSSGRP